MAYFTYRLERLKTAAIKAANPYYLDAVNLRVRELRVLRLLQESPGVTASELHLWEDAGAPLFIRVDQPSTLGVTLAAFGFTAFTAGRYPAAHGTISGTGLATPTF